MNIKLSYKFHRIPDTRLCVIANVYDFLGQPSYNVYLFDILLTWFLLTQILMINKLFTKGHTIFLERMTYHLEIKNSLS